VETVSALFIVALVIWAISSIGLIVLVLMHSGKGAGLSETFGGSMDPNIGTGLIEKNLNRITIVCTAIFIATLFLMIFIWPGGSANLPLSDNPVEFQQEFDLNDLEGVDFGDELTLEDLEAMGLEVDFDAQGDADPAEGGSPEELDAE